MKKKHRVVFYFFNEKGRPTRNCNIPEEDVLCGMFFSNVAMYFIVLTTAATLFKTSKTDINSAADAAQALRP